MDNLMFKEKFELKGKTAVVTGGIGILGKHFCRGLAEFGANIAVIDLDEKLVRDFAKELSSQFSIKAIGIQCDITNPMHVQSMVDHVVEEFGEVHILLNNAASKSANLDAFFAPFEDYQLDEWRKVMSVNIDGMFLVAQAVGKQMLKQGKGGSIIQTSSIYGIMAPDQRIYEGSQYMGRNINTPAVYSASKAAVIGLTKYLAAYWGKERIRVNAIVPGGNQSGQNQHFIERYSTRVPMGRMGNPDEMVGAVIYLASDASSYITGQELVIDGGLSTW